MKAFLGSDMITLISEPEYPTCRWGLCVIQTVLANRSWDWILWLKPRHQTKRSFGLSSYSSRALAGWSSLMLFSTLTEPLRHPPVLWFLAQCRFLPKSFRSPALKLQLRARQFPREQRKAAEAASEAGPNPCHVVTSSCPNADLSVFKGWMK